MGRGPRKFRPRRLTFAHIAVAESFWNRCLKRSQQKVPRVREYQVFCAANDLDEWNLPLSLAYYIGQAKSDGLGPRTLRRYIATIKGYYSGERHSISFQPTFKELMGVLHLESIKAPRLHAEDFNGPALLYFLRTLSDKNAWSCVVACTMLWTGLRYIDLQYLSCADVSITDVSFKVDISRTKAIRSEIQRTKLNLPARLWPEPIFSDLMCLTRRWISERRTATVAPMNTTAKDLNVLLDEAWNQRNGRHPTTYTFRRAAFHRIIEGCRDAQRSVNWKRVATYSLHLNDKTVKAFYHLGANKTKRSIDE